MKKILLLLFVALATTIGVWAEDIPIPISVHENSDESSIRLKNPISIPLVVFFDSDTNIVKVWCDNDNIQAEIYVYDENGAIEVYSSYMNVALQLTSNGTHYIKIIGDGWIAHGTF